ncbi:MAG: hypothetical protein ACE5PO_06835 [Candidatus Bathyarchaeia archaeon]
MESSEHVRRVKAIVLDPKLSSAERLNAMRMLARMGTGSFAALTEIARNAESYTVREAAQKQIASLLFKKRRT